MADLVDVYEVPSALGGGWAFAAGGRITDGYRTELEATKAAAEHLATLVCPEPDEHDEWPLPANAVLIAETVLSERESPADGPPAGRIGRFRPGSVPDGIPPGPVVWDDAPADDVPAGVHPEAAEYQRGWQAGFAHAKAIAPEPPPTDVADVMFGFINLYWNAERFRGSDPSIDASLDRAKALLFAPPAGSASGDDA